MESKKLDELEPELAERVELLPSREKDKNVPSKRKPQIMSKQSADAVPEKQPATPPQEPEDDDPVAKLIGNYGPWQLKLTFLLSLCSFPCTFHIFSSTFIAAEKEFWCARPAHLSSIDHQKWMNFSQPSNSCYILNADWSAVNTDNFTSAPILGGRRNREIPCTGWEWDMTVVGTTIISEWEFVCANKYINTITEVLFLFGVGVGGVVSGLISDRFGRKRTLIASLCMQSVLAISITFTPWYELYLLLRMFLGFFCVSVVMSGFVLAVELVGGKWRTIAGVCNFFPLPVSYIFVSAVSLALPEWRHLQLALSLPGVLLISLWWVVPESPRWLLTLDRISEVKDIMHQAAAYNKRTLPASIDKLLQPAGKPSGEKQQAATVVDLFRGPIRKNTICIFMTWAATTIVYYGLVLNIGSFGGDLHTTAMLSGVVELPAIALSMPILMKLGRRYPICFSILLAAVGCLGVAIVDALTNMQWLKITLMMISKFSISATNGVLPMYSAELYPTLMRNLGVGATQLIAGIGMVCIPYIWIMEIPYPMILSGIIGIIGGLCVLLLPETKNLSLTGSHFEDIERKPATNAGGESDRKPAYTISDGR